MNTFFKHLIQQKIIVLIIFILLMIAGILLLPLVRVNYDMTEYLPEDAGTKQAIGILQDEFGYPGNAEVMAREVSVAMALKIKGEIADISGVKRVLWLDDITDIKQPVEFIPPRVSSPYYIDDTALFRVEFTEDNYSEITSDAVEMIKELEHDLVVAGNAENARHMKSVLSGEIVRIIAFVLPVCLLILLLSSHSWIEPFLYLIVIGISIVINMGTNSIFPSISFITNSMASVLQLAICMDYSIFLMHRYFEERSSGSDVSDAVRNASVKSVSSISASALTTIAGFLALIFMRYKVGADVGLVLAKGIFISFISVILLMPVLIKLFSKTLDRARHRLFLPSFGILGRFAHRARYLIVILMLVIITPAFLAQDKNDFIYGDNSVTAGEGQAYENRLEIKERFGIINNIVILIPNKDPSEELELIKDLRKMPYTKDVLSLLTVADPAIPSQFLPKETVSEFVSSNHRRLILYLDIEGENAQTFDAVSSTKDILEEHYPGEWSAAGISTSLSDIRDTVRLDSRVVTFISLLAVGLVILFVFRSISIPIVLLLVIQSSVWINMSIPYFTSFKMAFIGYLVISSLQLGATIDYGILLTNRYMEFRKSMDPRNSLFSALNASGPSILVSAMILATAGFGFAIVSQVGSISELGLLIGRGALLSCVMTLILLPAMLCLFDKVILRTTLKREEKNENKT